MKKKNLVGNPNRQSKAGHLTRQLSMDKVNKKLSTHENFVLYSTLLPTNFSTPNGKCLAVCLAARRLFFGINLKNFENLNKKIPCSWLVLACVKSSDIPEKIFLIPWAEIMNPIDKLTRDKQGNLKIHVKSNGKESCIRNNSGLEDIDITKYQI